MANLPQVIVTLAPNGTLIAELPGPNGARRQVALGSGFRKDMGRDPVPLVEESLTRILQGQLASRVEIGLDGAPTQAQVKHWERHEIWADPTCRFCIAERGLHPRQKPKAVADKPVVVSKSNGVEIRRLSDKDRKALIKRADKALKTKAEAEQMAKLEPFFRSIGL
jgi:hypothetical protein